MLNTIKMDLYRMFKTKSLYVIWIILAAITIITTALFHSEYSDTEVQQANYEASQNLEEGFTEEAPSNLGMTVIIPTAPGEKITLYDMFFGNCQGKAIAIFMVIFSILFCTADSGSGYIKNIAGQIKNRGWLIISKIVCMALYTVLTMIIFLVIQSLVNVIFFGYFRLGDSKTFLLYFLAQTLLHFALILITSAIAIVLHNNVISMIIGICLCMNIATILYSAVDKLIEKTGVTSFHLLNYTVTGKISMLPMELTAKEGLSAIGVAVVFSVVFSVLCTVIFTKRDIH